METEFLETEVDKETEGEVIANLGNRLEKAGGIVRLEKVEAEVHLLVDVEKES